MENINQPFVIIGTAAVVVDDGWIGSVDTAAIVIERQPLPEPPGEE